MKDPKIIVKDIYKPFSETERRNELAKSITNLIKLIQEKETLALTNKREL